MRYFGVPQSGIAGASARCAAKPVNACAAAFAVFIYPIEIFDSLDF
jgi:hypothetical protein